MRLLMGKPITKPLTKARLLTHRKITSSGCWLWLKARDNKGYGVITAERRQYKIHRVAAHFWLGMELKDKRFVCHKCDNPPCFNPKHLFLGSNKDNILDALVKGRLPCGEAQWQTNMTWSDVREMRRQFATGVSKAELARRFGIAETTVREAVNMRTWRYENEPA